MPKESFVIPVDNSDEYIKECVVSLVAQSSDDVEFVLTSDDSSDLSCKFYDAFMTLKKELEKQNLFSKFEKSFVNSALAVLLHVLNDKNNKDDYIKFAELLKSKYFFDFNIAGHTRPYFYNNSDFDLLIDIVNKSGEELWHKYKNAELSTDCPLFDVDNWQNDEVVENDGSVKISVIIPVYNAEDYVEECVNSIRNNTFKNIEIICVNDGSTDNSLAVLNSLKLKDDRIVVVDKPNGGPSDTRNAGIDVAKGEYISFIDSDDYIHPKTYEFLYAKVLKENLDQLYFCAKSFFDGDDIKSKFFKFNDLYRRRKDYSDIVSGRQFFIESVNNAEFRPSPCMVISRREFLNKNNLRFEKGLLHEDNLFIIQCLTFAEKVSYVNADLYFRRVRHESIMTGQNYIKRIYSYYRIIKILEQFAKTENLKNDKLFFDALKYQLSVMDFSACDLAEKVDDKELEKFSDTLDEDEAIDFYNHINAVTRVRKNNKLNSKRAKDLNEKCVVNDYKYKYINHNLSEENKKLKNENNRLSKENKSLRSKILVRLALKIDAFISKLKGKM